jgi:hypothetical protein
MIRRQLKVFSMKPVPFQRLDEDRVIVSYDADKADARVNGSIFQIT